MVPCHTRMFENQPQGAAPASAPKEPADIFADLPASPPAGSASSAPPPLIGADSLDVSGPIFSRGKMWTTVGIGIVILALVGGGVWWFWWKPRQGIPARTVTTTTPVATVVPSVQPTVEPTPSSTPVPVDQDNDGLLDSEELILGTNVLLADTDSDGLLDREEVQVYMTNPLQADTDGDTYPDGVEIKNGYNPKGPGKLMNEAEDIKKLGQ